MYFELLIRELMKNKVTEIYENWNNESLTFIMKNKHNIRSNSFEMQTLMQHLQTDIFEVSHSSYPDPYSHTRNSYGLKITFYKVQYPKRPKLKGGPS